MIDREGAAVGDCGGSAHERPSLRGAQEPLHRGRCAALGQAPDVRNQASHEIRHQWLSAAKARRVLGWSPLFTLDEGLRRTVAWYRDHLRPQAARRAA